MSWDARIYLFKSFSLDLQLNPIFSLTIEAKGFQFNDIICHGLKNQSAHFP